MSNKSITLFVINSGVSSRWQSNTGFGATVEVLNHLRVVLLKPHVMLGSEQPVVLDGITMTAEVGKDKKKSVVEVGFCEDLLSHMHMHLHFTCLV
jgi:hypothetical protein